MLRHVFIINVKEGTSDDVVEQMMAEMRAMKEKETVIEDITVGRTRGLFGRPDAVMMVVDLKRQGRFRRIGPEPDTHRHCGKSRRGFRYAERRYCSNRILTLKTELYAKCKIEQRHRNADIRIWCISSIA